MNFKNSIFTLNISAVILILILPQIGAYPASVNEITGNRNVLQCYSDGLNIRCRDLLTGSDWIITERSPTTVQPWTGSINAGGTRLIYEDNGRNCVINLDGSSKQYITGLRTANGTFWRDEAGNDWAVYSNEEESYRQAGTTWMVRIDKDSNIPVDSTRTILLGEQYSCGLNGSGLYAGDVNALSFLYNIKSGKKSTILYDTTSRWEPKCLYGSIHPGSKPWLMFSVETPVPKVQISRWIEQTNTATTIWEYAYPAGKVYGHWSSTDSLICSILKDRQLLLTSITADTSGTTDNPGSFSEANTGLTLAADGYLIGGPWVGTRILTAGTPIITPNGGYEAKDTVLVSMSTISDSASIRYTTNGSTPTESSTLYTTPVALTVPASGSITITARTFRTGYAESPSAVSTFSRLVLNDSIIVPSVEQGLSYEYFEGIFLYPSDVLKDWASPCLRGVTDSFNIAMREREDHFGLSFNGYLRVPSNGKYTFYVTSDDSSVLYIDTIPTVATNYMWGTGYGFAGLKAGLHRISLIYQQGDGGKDLLVEYEGPGISRTAIPPSALFTLPSLIDVTAPSIHDTAHTGEAVNILWTAAAPVTSVNIDISLSPESAWFPLTPAPVAAADASWGNYSWTVPESLSTIQLHHAKAAFRVRSASDSTIAGYSSHRVLLINPLSVKNRIPVFAGNQIFRQTREGISVFLPAREQIFVQIFTADGRKIKSEEISGPGNHFIKTDNLPAGVYIFKTAISNVVFCRRMIISR